MKTCKRLNLSNWDNIQWGSLGECGEPAVVEYHYHLASNGDLPEIRGATPLCQKHYDETLAETFPHPDNIVPEEEQWQKI